jgi:myosin heavy subunit
MFIVQRRYNRARKGTIKLQAACRGRATRKMLAAIQAQKIYRRYITRKRFLKYKSAIISLQCATRKKSATKVLTEFKREQKDVGKLKQNNEKLKTEMASLRAMLAAQAKEGESEARNAKEMAEKQKEIDNLEKRVAELEQELKEAKEIVEKIEADMKAQSAQFAIEKEQMEQRVQFHTAKRASTVMPTHTLPPGSPKSTKGPKSSQVAAELNLPQLAAGEKGVTVNPDLLVKQRDHVQKLEEQLEAEKKLRREADGEIIKLRAAINGVKLNDSEVDALLGKKAAKVPAPSHPKVVDLVADTRYVDSHPGVTQIFVVPCFTGGKRTEQWY